jgi:hypothetical protein
VLGCNSHLSKQAHGCDHLRVLCVWCMHDSLASFICILARAFMSTRAPKYTPMAGMPIVARRAMRATMARFTARSTSLRATPLTRGGNSVALAAVNGGAWPLSGSGMEGVGMLLGTCQLKVDKSREESPPPATCSVEQDVESPRNASVATGARLCEMWLVP